MGFLSLTFCTKKCRKQVNHRWKMHKIKSGFSYCKPLNVKRKKVIIKYRLFCIIVFIFFKRCSVEVDQLLYPCKQQPYPTKSKENDSGEEKLHLHLQETYLKEWVKINLTIINIQLQVSLVEIPKKETRKILQTFHKG